MNDLARKETKAVVHMDRHGVNLQTIDDAFRWAQGVQRSGLAPSGMDTAEKIMVAAQAGMEIGFSPFQALQSLAIVHGRVSIMGAPALALVQSRGALEPGTQYRVRFEGKGDDYTAIATLHRKGADEPSEGRYAVADAKRRGLWGKNGPWKDEPDTMLEWRAVGRVLRRHFQDVLMGLYLTEEVRDIGPAKRVTPNNGGADPLLAEVVEPAAPQEQDAAAELDLLTSPGCPECSGDHKPSEACPE